MAHLARHKRYFFGSFVLDTSAASVRRGKEVLPLTRKRYEMLLLLVENAGRLMLKEEILERIWPDQYTGEANLANNIHAIRRLIEDDPRQPQLIVTVPGQGYRFQGEVKVLDDSIPAENGAFKGEELSSPPNDTSGKADRWSIRRGRVALVGVILLLVAVIGGWSIFRVLSPQNQPAPAIPRLLTSSPGPERFPALSGDGRMVAFIWAGDQMDNDDIYVKQTVASEAIRVTTHPGSDRKPTWSPDGHYLAFLRAARQVGEPYHLLIIPALGGAEREVARVDDGLDWSPDGQYLAVTGLSGPDGGMGIHLIGVDGGQRRRITELAAKGGLYDAAPRFSPDGRSLAFLRYKGDLLCEIFIADLTSGKIRQVSDNQKMIKSETLHWSPDGQRLCFISNRTGGSHLWQISATGGVAEIVLNLPIPMTSLSIARKANSLVYISEQEEAQIEIFEMNGSGKRACLINSSMADHGAMWSPDGSQVVFSSNQTGWNELWLARKDCTGVRQLTSFREIGVGSPRWSPDGRLIAFDRRVNGQSDVYTIQVEDLQVRKVTDSAWSSMMPSWSPDGEWIYFTSNRVQSHNLFQIWKIPASGGDPRQVTFDGQRNSRGSLASPDGKFLYFNRQNRLWRRDLSTDQETPIEQLSTLYLTRDWDIARGGIYFLEPDSGDQLRLYRLDLATGNRSLIKQLTSNRNLYVPNLSVSPDEQRYALTTISNESCDIMLVEGWR
ncbi:MAG: hypothetical protein EBZ36_02660 [Acidobacteria bacterium]|nr:hypothetical protein [Acidobacteriota bacterium]